MTPCLICLLAGGNCPDWIVPSRDAMQGANCAAWSLSRKQFATRKSRPLGAIQPDNFSRARHSTNVLIHALNGDAQASILSRIDDAIANQARYSVVTRMELLGWNGHTADSRRETAALLTQLMEISLTPTIVALVIDIRSTITIKLPDAIILDSSVDRLPKCVANWF